MRIFLEYLLIYFFFCSRLRFLRNPLRTHFPRVCSNLTIDFQLNFQNCTTEISVNDLINGESFHVGVKGDKGDLCSADCCFYRRVNAREIFSDKLYLTQSEISVWEYYYYWLNQFMMTAQWGLGWLLLSSFSNPRSPPFHLYFSVLHPHHCHHHSNVSQMASIQQPPLSTKNPLTAAVKKKTENSKKPGDGRKSANNV